MDPTAVARRGRRSQRSLLTVAIDPTVGRDRDDSSYGGRRSRRSLLTAAAHSAVHAPLALLAEGKPRSVGRGAARQLRADLRFLADEVTHTHTHTHTHTNAHAH
eukprot:7280164-Pyramimonas_sp.AAC.2